MAHRRNHGGPKTSSPLDDHRSPPAATAGGGAAGDEGSSLAAQAILASSAHRDSSLSSVYGESAIASSARRESNRHRPPPPHRTAAAYEYTSIENLNESKSGFWGILARKAKSLIDDESATQQFENHGRTHSQMADTSKPDQARQSYRSPEGFRKSETPSPQRADTLASSLNYIGGTIKNALGEGLTIVENRTADIIQETRKLRVRRKGSPNTQNQAIHIFSQHGLPQNQTDLETQLKASRDVANAMSAKAKLLLRELKTVKADLAFAKERCAQLEEENKILRESYENGSNPEDDDLIRLQLETLLAEKGRLAHENSVYARENRFLREIVEYHQLTMQDLVYVDEGIEEVAEVSPIHIPPLSSPSRAAPPSPITPNPRPSTNPTAYTPSSLPASTSTVSDASPFIPTTPTLSPSQAFSETASPNPTRQPDPSDSIFSR